MFGNTNNTLKKLRATAKANPTDLKPYTNYLQEKTSNRQVQFQKVWNNDHVLCVSKISNDGYRNPVFNTTLFKIIDGSIANKAFFFTIQGIDDGGKNNIQQLKDIVGDMLSVVKRKNMSLEKTQFSISNILKGLKDNDKIKAVISNIVTDDFSPMTKSLNDVVIDVSGYDFRIVKYKNGEVEIMVYNDESSEDDTADKYRVEGRNDKILLVRYLNENMDLVKKLRTKELVKILQRLGITVMPK